jgi:hypothetical protein
MLKDEISESSLRLKAAKYGLPLRDIVPEYDNTFYLPQKDQFILKKPYNSRNQKLPHS